MKKPHGPLTYTYSTSRNPKHIRSNKITMDSTPLPKRKTFRRFSRHTVAQALQDCGGVISDVARTLQTTRARIYRLLKKWPDLQKVQDEQCEVLVDEAEAGIREAVKRKEPWALKLVATTKGKHRGWTTSSEVQSTHTERLEITTPPMTLEQFQQEFGVDKTKVN